MPVQERSISVETLVVSRIDLNRVTNSVSPTLSIGPATTADAMTFSGGATISGALTITGAVTTTSLQLPSTAGPTTGALTAAMSGRLCIGAVDAAYELPAVTGNAGVWYDIITGVASAGTGLTVTATTAVIQAKVSNAAAAAAITNATTITNSGATDIVGDRVRIVCNGAKWWVHSQSGTWA